jgi:2',3'-cyclic-nucleotide 2'-phosphodiesterase (5'-nucleotidase family)
MDATICDTEGSLAHFMNAIPAGSADLIVTGGGPGKIANVINGTPVLQAFGQGSSFARIDLVWSTKDKMLVTNKLRIHQPIRVCHRFFKKTDDCYTEDESIDHRELVPARFLGEQIFPDTKTAAWLEFWRKQVASQIEPLIESPSKATLNEKLTQALMSATEAQVVVTDEAGLLLNLPLGTSTWRDVFKSKAAHQRLITVKISANQMRLLKDHFSELTWHDRLKEKPFSDLTEITLLTLEKIWQDKIHPYTKEQSISTQGFLSPLIVADSLISWQQDTVGVQASGRSPALPRNQ